jgi:hypothetical protein
VYLSIYTEFIYAIYQSKIRIISHYSEPDIVLMRTAKSGSRPCIMGKHRFVAAHYKNEIAYVASYCASSHRSEYEPFTNVVR